MIPTRYSKAEERAMKSLLASNHQIFIRIRLLSLDHEYLSDLSNKLVDGQVDIDSTADITRSLKVAFLDPTFKIHLDGDSPTEGALYMDKMLSVIYVVMDPSGDTSYNIPIFCGPITKVDRSGPYVMCEALGKEVLASSALWKGKTFKKGLRKTSVIKQILRNLAGENKLSVPTKNKLIPRNLSVSRQTTPWAVAQKVARSLNMQLFYDGRGRARLRKIPSNSVYVFKSGRGGSIQSEVEVGFDTTKVINAVEVVGAKPKGAKRHIRHRAVAARSHPLSPWKLGRGGVPRYLPLVIKDDSIRTKAEARQVARKRLKNGLLEAVDVAFDCLPMPFLEPLDITRVQTDDFIASFRLRKMSIPLTANSSSTVGYHKRVTPNRRAIRTKNKRRRRTDAR